jgi:hypothetical protein
MPGKFVCECPRGFNGTRCETDIDLCEEIQYAIELLQLNHSAYCKYNCADFAPDNFICTCGDNQTLALEFSPSATGFNTTAYNSKENLKQQLIEEIAKQLGLDPSDIDDIDLLNDRG